MTITTLFIFMLSFLFLSYLSIVTYKQFKGPNFNVFTASTFISVSPTIANIFNSIPLTMKICIAIELVDIIFIIFIFKNKTVSSKAVLFLKIYHLLTD